MKKLIGVGIIGANPDRGWAKEAHLPALQALPEFEIRAVSTTQLQSAEKAAKQVGDALAFDDYRALLTRPEIDLVVISVNVMKHRSIALDAIAAGKSVFCEWPLGRNLAEAEEMAEAARSAGVETIIGLQGRFSPSLQIVRDHISDGYVGKVIGTSIRGSAPHEVWDGVLDSSYEFHADPANGATMLSIPAAHTIDMLISVLGDFSEVGATMVAGRGHYTRAPDGATIATNAIDTISISGLLRESGAVASLYFHGGASLDADFSWEIHGTEGDLLITADSGFANMAALRVVGSRKRGEPELLYYDVHGRDPAALSGPAVNHARLYRQFAADRHDGTRRVPDFETGLLRHRLLHAIETATASGERQLVSAS